MARRTLQEAIQDPDFRRDYEDWRASPFTDELLRLIRSSVRAPGLVSRTGESALYYAGQVDAVQEFYDYLLDLVNELNARAEAAKRAQAQLPSTYGVQKDKFEKRQEKPKKEGAT